VNRIRILGNLREVYAFMCSFLIQTVTILQLYLFPTLS
jgi:hypothetical protein